MQAERQKMVIEKRGSILLMVLVLIIIVSYVLTKFVERANVAIQGEGYYVERSRLRLHAWSYLEIIVAVLADVKAIDNAIYAPSQGWANPLEYAQIEVPAGLNVTIEFIDESAKPSINELDEGSLFLLFDEMGFDLDVSQPLANTLLDWIDEDDFNPAYLKRAVSILPRRLDDEEWRHSQDYWREKDEFPAIDLADDVFVYTTVESVPVG